MSEGARIVLIAVDGSEYSERAFNWYLEKIRKEHDKVVLVYVTETPNLHVFSLKSGLAPTEEWGETMGKLNKEASDIEGSYVSRGLQEKLRHEFFHVKNKSPGVGIVEKAEEFKAELIIMGTRGQNKLRRTILGSVSDYVIHHAGIPVAVVPPGEK